jgi:hypothetical protein
MNVGKASRHFDRGLSCLQVGCHAIELNDFMLLGVGEDEFQLAGQLGVNEVCVGVVEWAVNHQCSQGCFWLDFSRLPSRPQIRSLVTCESVEQDQPLVSRVGGEFLRLALETCEILSFSEKGTKKAVVPEEAGVCHGIHGFR